MRQQYPQLFNEGNFEDEILIIFLGILYWFSNVFGCSSFIFLGPPTCPIGFTSFVSFKFILCISIIISSISLSLIWFILFQFLLLLFVFLLFFFFFFSNSKYCSNNFSSRLPFSMFSLFIVLSGYFLNIICSTIFPVVPFTYFEFFLR